MLILKQAQKFEVQKRRIATADIYFRPCLLFEL